MTCRPVPWAERPVAVNVVVDLEAVLVQVPVDPPVVSRAWGSETRWRGPWRTVAPRFESSSETMTFAGSMVVSVGASKTPSAAL